MLDNSPELTIRKLEVDIESGFDRHWHSNDAFLSQYYNALSMGFPIGEQRFIDAVRDCAELLPNSPDYDQLRSTVAQFIGQEATHRHIHALYNKQLGKQGLVNHLEFWANKRLGLALKLGFKPVPFSELTDDEEFWKGCQGCRNFDILVRNNYKMCLCTGLLYDPEDTPQRQQVSSFAKKVVKPIVKKKTPNKLFKK